MLLLGFGALGRDVSRVCVRLERCLEVFRSAGFPEIVASVVPNIKDLWIRSCKPYLACASGIAEFFSLNNEPKSGQAVACLRHPWRSVSSHQCSCGDSRFMDALA